MVQLNFDARTVEPIVGIEPVPAGWYKVMIDDSERRPTKNADGSYINLRYSIIEGQYAGRKIFQMLNIENPSVQAKEIAFRQLSAIQHAIGVLQITDTAELHGKPLQIRVRIQKDPNEQYPDQNQVSGYKNINDTVPGSGQPITAAPTAAAPSAPQGWAMQTSTPTAPAPTLAPTPVAAPAADEYQYTPDKKHRWKPGMANWEAVPVAAPVAPPPVTVPVPPPVETAPNGATPGWTPPANPQPWATQTSPDSPAAPANPISPAPPWATPKS